MSEVVMPDQIVAAPPPPASAAAEWHRRIRVRHPFHCAAVVTTPQSPAPFHEGVLHDISVEGIAFLLKVAFPRGTRLTIELVDTSPPRRLTACVVHATARGEDWLLGCELERPLSVAELYGLIDR
jgi:hypothetical protein